MAQTIAVPVQYGAAELKTVAQKYMMLGLLSGHPRLFLRLSARIILPSG